ncbi:hypothetical protein BHM03_00002711 [Ensete ventricosum]|nr:hypothetical protein BHM03_00002711 [Ensete ventricosum]
MVIVNPHPAFCVESESLDDDQMEGSSLTSYRRCKQIETSAERSILRCLSKPRVDADSSDGILIFSLLLAPLASIAIINLDESQGRRRRIVGLGEPAIAKKIASCLCFPLDRLVASAASIVSSSSIGSSRWCSCVCFTFSARGNKMAAVAEKAIGADNQVVHRQSPAAETESEYQRDVKNLVDLLSKLNPSAKEFFPSSYAAPGGGGAGGHRVSDGRISADAPIFVSWNDFYHNNLLMTNNGSSKDSSSDGSSNNLPNPRVIASIPCSTFNCVTEEKLAEVFANCGPIVRCFITLYFSAGVLLTAKISMQSEDEKEMVVRTIYCTNIDKKVNASLPPAL